MILKEELPACARSKRSLAQHLEATEQSMLAIIGQYKEELAVRSNLKVIDEENFKAPEEDEEVGALKLELGKARLAKEKFKSALHTSGRSALSYERKTRPLQEPLNKKPKGPARRNMAERNSKELCGVATMSSSSEERKETSHGCMA